MANILKLAGALVAGVVIGYFAVGPTFGGVYNQVSNTFREGLNAGTTNQFTVSSAGVVSTSGTLAAGAITGTGLTVTTTNAATSTTSVGCVQTTATSTATPIKLEFSTGSTTVGLPAGTAGNGLVSWRYGSCP